MSPTDIENYISALADARNDIDDVITGDYDQIAIRQPSEIAYPCCWIETPELRLNGDADQFGQVYTTSYSVLDKYELDDHEHNRLRKDATYSAAVKMLIKMIIDVRDEGTFTSIDLSRTRIEYIPAISADMDHGWRVSVVVSVPIDFACYDESEWTFD